MHLPSAYFTHLPHAPNPSEWSRVAESVYAQTFRSDLTAPGFSLLSFAVPISSEELRARMIELKRALSAMLFTRTGKFLVYQSMARFNQQNTTKFHVDGAPEESFLMLGYEPSEVASTLAMADYTLAAWKHGITPAALVSDHNPMYASGARLLQGTITPLTAFDPGRANILVINNSSLPYAEDGRNLLGVMHQATIPKLDAKKNRIINSTMMRTAASLAEEALTPEKQQAYVTTAEVSGPSAY
jgi:hypothetical protein